MAILLADLVKAGFVLNGNTLVRGTPSAELSAKKPKRVKNLNILEERFAELWGKLEGPELVHEFRFFPERRWRADFAHLPSFTLIEVEGGLYGHGRHNSPEGFMKDAEKYNKAALLGYRTFRLASKMITEETLLPIIELCRRIEATAKK